MYFIKKKLKEIKNFISNFRIQHPDNNGVLRLLVIYFMALILVMASYLIINDDTFVITLSNCNNLIINDYLAFFSKAIICWFSNFSFIFFHLLFMVRAIFYCHIWYNVFMNIVFWLYQFKISIKPTTLVVFLPLILFCIFEDTANFSFCMDGQQRPVFPEPNYTPEYLNLPYLQLEAFCQERISINNALRQEENQLERQLMVLTQARENNQQVDSIDEMEKIRRLETIKIKRLQVIEDQICFEHAKSYKLEQMERVSR